MSEKGTEISIGKGGFSFKTDGEASERLANAALDFLSPLTEGAGFLGTKLRGYRMEAALNATLKAKQICEENNLKIKPVQPKFLLQWIEGASLEDIESEENLSEIWAELLVSASQKNTNNHLIYIDILKKLSSEHLDHLSHMLQGKDGVCISASKVSSFIMGLNLSEISKRTRTVYKNGETTATSNFQSALALSKDMVQQLNETPGLGVYSAVMHWKTLTDTQSSPVEYDIATKSLPNKDFLPRNIEYGLSLHALGLTNVTHYQPIETNIKNLMLNVNAIILTNFGRNFLTACGR